MKKYIIPFVLILASVVQAQDYKASLFGCMSDGITNNTRSIQTAIDIISERGGGMLHFYVGKYLTGTVYLKNNVHIVLHEGATLTGLPSAYDYAGPVNAPKGIIVAEEQQNVGILGTLPERILDFNVVGKGIILGQGDLVRNSIQKQIDNGYLKETLAQASPAIASFSGCTGVKVTGLFIQDSANDVFVFTNCTDVECSRHLIESKLVAGSNGIVLNGCKNVTASDSFFTVTGKPIQQGSGNKGIKTKGNKTKAGYL